MMDVYKNTIIPVFIVQLARLFKSFSLMIQAGGMFAKLVFSLDFENGKITYLNGYNVNEYIHFYSNVFFFLMPIERKRQQGMLANG